MRKLLKILLLLALVVPLALVGFVWWKLQPVEQRQPMPASLVGIDTSRGEALLAGADHVADYAALVRAFQSQQLISYCGVATGATVLKALGQPIDQAGFFTPAASAVRSRLQVTLGGMSLPQLEALLAAHGLQTGLVHGQASTLGQFRQAVRENLERPGDYMVVNYQREVLGQDRVGHISPLGAYHSESDRVLILDTASYKYPHTWVPLEQLFAAMVEVDSASGKSRGYLAVRRPLDSFY
jgi:hypothetical protein